MPRRRIGDAAQRSFLVSGSHRRTPRPRRSGLRTIRSHPSPAGAHNPDASGGDLAGASSPHSNGISTPRDSAVERPGIRTGFGLQAAGRRDAGLTPGRSQEERTQMAQLTYDEVNLMLRLYDMRREPRLRQARAWFIEHFHPVSPEEMMLKFPQGGEENTYI